MINDWLKLIRTAVLIIGLFLSFFAFIEIIRAYQTLYQIHFLAGYIFLIVLFVVFISLILYFGYYYIKIPKSINPPSIPLNQQDQPNSLKKRLNYLYKYLQKMLENPAVSKKKHKLIQEAQDQIKHSLALKDNQQMKATINLVEEKTILPLLQNLDKLALKQLRNSMRDIMLIVSLSPYKSADLLIVLYRNFDMSLRIIRIYNSRPSVTENFRILIDIFYVVATVNYINVGKNLIENLASKMPGVKHLVDDIAQGIGAGFMTTIVGHAVIDRSRKFNPWDQAEAKRKILSKVGDFFKDVRELFFTDIWQSIADRAGNVPKNIRTNISEGIDKTSEKVKNIIVPPISAAKNAGISISEILANSGNILKNKFYDHAKRVDKLIANGRKKLINKN